MKYSIAFFVLVSFALIVNANTNEICYNQEFDNNAVYLTNNSNNTSVSYEGLELFMIEGLPCLPYKEIKFSVPYNAYNFSISATSCGELYEFPLSNPLMQYAEERNASGDDVNHLANNHLYEELITGKKSAIILSESYLGAFNKTLSVIVSPFLLSDDGNQLQMSSNVSLKIKYDCDVIQNRFNYLIPQSIERINENITYAQSLVINPEDIVKNIPPEVVNIKRTRSIITNPEYEHIIVTSKPLKDSFTRLVEMRRLKGMRSKIFCIEDIMSDPKYANGDQISGITTNAGKLRAFLKDAYTNYNTKYALLAGKDPLVPTMVYGVVSETNTENLLETTDFYYGELNNDWSGVLKENPDLSSITDFDCELSVGRLNCTTREEVERYIEKLWYYEFNPGNGDPYYVMDAYMTFQYPFYDAYFISNSSVYNPNKKVISLYDQLFNVDYQFETEPGQAQIEGKKVLKHLNEEHFGFVDFVGHGGPVGVSLSTNGIGKTLAINSFDLENWKYWKEDNNGLDNWKNKFYPNWTYSISCTLSPYRILPEWNEFAGLRYTFAESYLFGGEYGGIAFIGNTREGEFSCSPAIESYFLENLLNCRKEKKASKIGRLLSTALARATFPIVSQNKYKIRCNLSGDPAIDLWNDVPLKYDFYPIIKPNTTQLPDSTYLTIIDMNNPSNMTCTNIPEGMSTRLTDDNKIYVNFCSNLIPYILPINIKNNVFDKTGYLIVDDLTIGKFTHDDNANVVFDSTSDMTIEAHGNVYINQGTQFVEGAKLRIYAPYQDVYLSDFTLPAGCTLELIGIGTLTMDRDVKIHEDANFIVSYKTY